MYIEPNKSSAHARQDKAAEGEEAIEIALSPAGWTDQSQQILCSRRHTLSTEEPSPNFYSQDIEGPEQIVNNKPL